MLTLRGGGTSSRDWLRCSSFQRSTLKVYFVPLVPVLFYTTSFLPWAGFALFWFIEMSAEITDSQPPFLSNILI